MKESVQNTLSSTPIYDEMRNRIDTVRSRYYLERMLKGTAWTLTLFFLLAAAVILVEAVVRLSMIAREVMVYGTLITAAGAASATIVRPFLERKKILPSKPWKYFALLVGDHFPDIKDRLRNILEVFEERQKPGAPNYSPELIDASFIDLQEAASSLSFTNAVELLPSLRSLKRIGLSALCAGFLIIVLPLGLHDALIRILHYGTDYRPPLPFMLTVRPGDREIVKGSSVAISISAEANTASLLSGFRTYLPKEIYLSIQPSGVMKPEVISLRGDSSGIFTYTLNALRQSVEYYAESGEVRSSSYTITVADRPVIRSLRLHVTPPFYSRLPAQWHEENVGDLSALAGSIVRWEIVPSKQIGSGRVVMKENGTAVLNMKGKTLTASVLVTKSTTYHIDLEDAQGIGAINPIEYRLEIVPDEVPTVTILFPGKNIDVTDAAELPLQIKIQDDFGFSSLRLAYRIVQSRYEPPQETYTYVTIPLPKTAEQVSFGTDENIGHTWNLSGLHLVPEDVVEYRAEVFDNDNVSGPKQGISESFMIRLPSLDEVFADAEKNQSGAIDKLGESLKQAEEIKKDLDELSREMRKTQQADWQKQKKTEEVSRKYQEMQKNIDDVNRTVESMTQELQKNNVLSQETMEKYMELQKLFQEMNLKELQEAMKRMQDAMQNVSPEQMRQAMQQVQFSEDAFRKSLERTMNLLKRIQIEQKLDELVKRAADLRQQQDSVQEETKQLQPGDKKKADDLAQRQGDIRKQLEELQRQLPDLRRKMDEFPKDMPMKELQDADEAANDTEMEQSLDQSAQDLQSGRSQQAQQSQQKASSKMKKMSQSFSDLQQKFLQNQMEETMNSLRKAMKDLLELSQRQEILKNQSQAMDPNSPQLRENTSDQANLQGDLSNVANALMDLSQSSFAVTPEMGREIGKALSSMNHAMTNLDQRNGPSAAAMQGNAMASLNKSASLVQGSMEAMQQGEGGSGAGSLLQQLQRMSGQQQNINAQTQQMGQGGKMSQEQMQQMGRLAQQQDAVRKSLEQLNSEAQRSSERNKILGDLQKIADQMKEVVHDMEQNDVNPNTLRQQERILSRLLDAQQSFRERDFEQRRKSASGTSPVRTGPKELKVEEESNRLRKDLLRAMEEGYSKEYQELLRKYYEALTQKK